MRSRWIYWLGGSFAALAILGFVVLESMRAVGFRRGVETVALPVGSRIEALSSDPDYWDSYRVPVAPPVALDSIERFVFQGGTEVARTPNELVFEGRAPGLRFLISYYLTDPGPAQTLTVSTLVEYESWLGALYFAPVEQVHKRGVPFIVSRVAAPPYSGPP